MLELFIEQENATRERVNSGIERYRKGDFTLTLTDVNGAPLAGKPVKLTHSYIEANLLKGAPIDAIGSQFHLFYPAESEYAKTRPYYNPENLYRHMDMYASFGKPLQVTEITIPAYSNAPRDEEIQAEIIRRLYEIWFSHPNMEQIIYWNLVDGYAYVENPTPEKIACQQGDMTIGENVYYGGLLRFDMTPKPAYYTIRDLFGKVWHTETEGVTDAKGEIRFRGFFGEYEVGACGTVSAVNCAKALPETEAMTRKITVKIG